MSSSIRDISVAAGKCELFAGIDKNDLESLISCLGARLVRLEKGGFFIRTGDRADRFGVVLLGSLSVVQYDVDGRRTIVKNIPAPGLVGAAQALADVQSFAFDVEADEPAEVLVMHTARILTPCERDCRFHARLVRNLMSSFAAKTLELNHKIDILSRRTTAEKLLTYLRGVVAERGTREFDIPFDRQQLADFLCVERSALSAEINRLARVGVFDCRKSHFRLRARNFSTPVSKCRRCVRA